ncbi:hypothetical protein K8U54_19245 [Pseudomonas fulva]|jgi:hypothetical protein|uniref:hypothetical protein n=1 Tax=Pseudomonas fulva TaxID=47880 RepID=UPI00201D410B|nr:hypothetical protein [Pseudomonas fulva]UQY33827.1 hypothetical protein K8U54_19245 [Pseudomonas fulva]
MKFVNNWMRPVTLAAGVTALDLDLADGEYRLTLADDAAAATRWEVVQANVVGGSATLQRAQEGTTDQDWPEGSVIYNAITAGWLTGIDTRVTDLEQSGGGGGGPVVTPDRPQDAPAYTGQIHVWEGVASYVALANNTPEDWALFAGADGGYGYSLNPGSPGVVYQLPRHARRIQVTAELGALPEGFPLTLVVPAWEGTPHGWSLDVEATDIGLSLDFSALGSMLQCSILDFGTGTTATVAGTVLILRNSQPISISIREAASYVEGAYCSLELRSHTIPTISFLPVPEE